MFEIAKTAAGYASTPTTLVSFNGTDGPTHRRPDRRRQRRPVRHDSRRRRDGDGTVFEITGSGFATTTPSTLPEGVLFEGQVSSGQANLWETNGAAAGTIELTGVAGASPSGLFPLEFTSYDDEVLFSGVDASGDRNLWVNEWNGGRHV